MYNKTIIDIVDISKVLFCDTLGRKFLDLFYLNNQKFKNSLLQYVTLHTFWDCLNNNIFFKLKCFQKFLATFNVCHETFVL